MRMTLITNGVTFKSPLTDEVSVEEAKATIYGNIQNMNKLEMVCEDGSYVIIGVEALQNAIIIFSEV